MDTNAAKSVVIIPSLEPDSRLLPYVKTLLEAGFTVLVVDDGSGAPYQPIFNEIEAADGCHVLHHEVNRGKGSALKTAYRYLLDGAFQSDIIITADADGQHTVQDVQKVETALKSGAQGLVLGSRDFKLSHVPFKSRAGNRITSIVFWLLYGVWCADTQTGLRGFRHELLETMSKIPGERFEYEMTVLIDLSRTKVKLTPVSIETIYENENAGSHFNPIKDSIRIYKVIFGNFFKFISTSLITTGLDMGIYYILFDVFDAMLMQPDALRIGLAKGIARIVSAFTNFKLNKAFVFKLKAQGRVAGLRYAALCVLILGLSIGIVTLFEDGFGMNERITSPIVDMLLFFLSYRVQRNWVFREEKQ